MTRLRYDYWEPKERIESALDREFILFDTGN